MTSPPAFWACAPLPDRAALSGFALCCLFLLHQLLQHFDVFRPACRFEKTCRCPRVCGGFSLPAPVFTPSPPNPVLSGLMPSTFPNTRARSGRQTPWALFRPSILSLLLLTLFSKFFFYFQGVPLFVYPPRPAPSEGPLLQQCRNKGSSPLCPFLMPFSLSRMTFRAYPCYLTPTSPPRHNSDSLCPWEGPPNLQTTRSFPCCADLSLVYGLSSLLVLLCHCICKPLNSIGAK